MAYRGVGNEDKRSQMLVRRVRRIVNRAPVSLTLLAAPLALCRLAADEPVPAWTVLAHAFLTISRTPSELSIVADEAAVPADILAARDYRALRVDGPMALDLIGVIASLAAPLSAAKVPIFPIATYDTDYVLVHQGALSRAIAALEGAGHRVTLEVAE